MPNWVLLAQLLEAAARLTTPLPASPQGSDGVIVVGSAPPSVEVTSTRDGISAAAGARAGTRVSAVRTTSWLMTRAYSRPVIWSCDQRRPAVSFHWSLNS